MLVSLSDMKDYLGITGATYDTFLTQQITLISETIETYCRRKFEQATWTQTFHFDDYNSYLSQLVLFHFPIISITSIVEGDYTYTADDYRLQKPMGILTRTNNSKFFEQADEVEVTFVAGYASIPEPIRAVVFSLVEERYNKKISGVNLNFGSDVQSISIPGTVSVQFDYSLQSNERSTGFGSILGTQVNVLDAYRSERAVTGQGTITYVG